MMSENTIYICGYPKSGTTYLTRLLGDVLNSPTGGSTPAEDKNEPATWKIDRPGNYIVRKGHFIVVDDRQNQAVVKPHRMNPRYLKSNQKVICVFRDPRDIAVSMSHYWGLPVDHAITQMRTGTGHCRLCGNWSVYTKGWVDLVKSNWQVTFTTFESLRLDTFMTLLSLCSFVGEDVSAKQIAGAVERNTVANTKKFVEENIDNIPLSLETNQRLVRRGETGEWRSHFDNGMNDTIWAYFGDMMRLLGYVKK